MNRLEIILRFFFCKDNIPFAANALIKIQQHTLVDSNDPTNIIPRSYFIISETTGLELLRQTFAIDTFATPASQIIQEQYLFKAILLLNASISHFEVDYEYTENGDLSDLFYAKSLLCSFLNNYESTNLQPEYVAMLQIIKGFYFFQYCENSKLKEHLKLFLEQNGFASWQLYLYNVIKLLLYPLKNKNGYAMIVLDKNGEGYQFLHSLAFPIESIISLDCNNDYTYFKTHPLIEVDTNSFIPINTIFCINHLYKSIYFSFRTINETLKESEFYIKGRGLRTIFTTEFSEQYLFNIFMRNSLSKNHGIKLSDDDCKTIAAIGHEPDFYYRDGNNIYLFENKDILISDKVKRSGRYDEIETVLNKKLINDAGISQLVSNIEKINSRNFIWDKRLPQRPRVYPILVLDDASLCIPGLNYILNDAFQEQIKKANINIKVFPLALIELDTLIAYADNFKRGVFKLKEIIGEYLKFQNRQPKRVSPDKILEEVYKRYFPFYFFMSAEYAHSPFDDTLFGEICDKLREATDDV